MYVVTFYSYKGGVGRTMALLNTAVMLAKADKRVLLVDFDLEAPGLTSFDPLQCARSHPGLVDYVTQYRCTLEAPLVSDFIVETQTDKATLWVMPAGDNTAPDYNAKLNSIDWEKLYSDEHGYLMFDDMKSQWANYDTEGFDYVFIDSRTGHTDVGGICTRQLPDAVVIMFLPNEQNIDGLVPIVRAIRAEDRGEAGNITLHFCPSNVPDEFDEHGLLDRMLKLAGERLGYSDRIGVDQPAAILRHWSSLDLLTQPALAVARPNSRLATEYSALRVAIEACNLADENGALEALSKARRELKAARRNSRSGNLAELTLRGQEIRRLHPESGKIAFSAAHLFNELKEFGLEVAALTDAIELKERPVESRLARALALHNSRRSDEAIKDLAFVLTSKKATKFELEPAFRVLTLLDENWLETSKSLYHRRGLNFRAKAILAEAMMTKRENLIFVIKDMETLSRDQKLNESQRYDAFVMLILAQIGNHMFKEAISHFDRTEVENHGTAVDAFNLAIALWGMEGAPPKKLLNRVVETAVEGDANVHQCLALAHSVLGNLDEAARHLAFAQERIGVGALVFSCWRYLRATTKDMEVDILEMRGVLEAGHVLKPAFLNEKGNLPAALAG